MLSLVRDHCRLSSRRPLWSFFTVWCLRWCCCIQLSGWRIWFSASENHGCQNHPVGESRCNIIRSSQQEERDGLLSNNPSDLHDVYDNTDYHQVYDEPLTEHLYGGADYRFHESHYGLLDSANIVGIFTFDHCDNTSSDSIGSRCWEPYDSLAGKL